MLISLEAVFPPIALTCAAALGLILYVFLAFRVFPDLILRYRFRRAAADTGIARRKFRGGRAVVYEPNAPHKKYLKKYILSSHENDAGGSGKYIKCRFAESVRTVCYEAVAFDADGNTLGAVRAEETLCAKNGNISRALALPERTAFVQTAVLRVNGEALEGEAALCLSAVRKRCFAGAVTLALIAEALLARAAVIRWTALLFADPTPARGYGGILTALAATAAGALLSLWLFRRNRSFDGVHVLNVVQTHFGVSADHDKLEAKIKTMKRSVYNWIAGGALIVMAIVLKIYCTAMTGSDSRFFALFALALCLLGLWLFVAEALHRNECRRRERALLDRESEALFSDAEETESYDAAQMLAESADRGGETLPECAALGEEEAAYFDGVDRARDFGVFAREFEIFARERGFRFHRDEISKLFASLASSRLIVCGGVQTERFRAFMQVLSEYFESEPRVCAFAEADEAMQSAAQAARRAPDTLHAVGFFDTVCAETEERFASFLDGAPRNLWIVLCLADGETAEGLPLAVALAASVNGLSFSVCPEADTRTPVRHLGCHQLAYMKEKSAAFLPEEALWKKVDLLEQAVFRAADFRIENKHWLRLEDFACVCAACGTESGEALEQAVAARLLAPMAAVCRVRGADVDWNETVREAFSPDVGA